MSLTEQAGRISAEPGEANLLGRSLLYREHLAERGEILRHKWYESERAGRDIGFEAALVSWVLYHRSKWRKSRQTQAPPAFGGS